MTEQHNTDAKDHPEQDVGDSSSHEDRKRQGAADDTNEETVEDTVNVTLTVNINVEWHDGSRYKMTDDHLAEWEDFFQEAEK